MAQEDSVGEKGGLFSHLYATLAQEWVGRVLIVLLVLVFVQLVIIYYGKLWRDKERHGDKERHEVYGNWSQTAAVAAATILGLSSLVVSFNTYSLQQTLRADAARDRAARSIQYAHTQERQDIDYIEAHDTKRPLRPYDCIYYLRDRLTYTPKWFEQPEQSPYSIDSAKVGTPPENDDPNLYEGSPDTRKWNREILSKEFWKCASVGEPPQPVVSPEVLGAKIKRLIVLPLDLAEVALGEWGKVKKDEVLEGARKLLLCEVGNDLCGSEIFKEDIYALFTQLHQHNKDGDPAVDFSRRYLTRYNNLSTFLKDNCSPTPSEVERGCSSEEH